MTRASDFWISDRAHDLELGGWPLKMQAEVLAELQASRARERELEQALGDPQGVWTEKTMRAVAERAAQILPPVERQLSEPKGVWLGNLARAIDRAIADAYREVGLVGDHPGLRLQAKLLLMRMRADVRAAVEPAPQTSSARSTSRESQPAR